MAIQGVTYDNQRVSAADHAALFQMFITDGKMSGCGISTSLNTLTISSGSFIVAGRLTKINGSQIITVSTDVENTTKKLIGVCDMGGAHTRTEFGQFYFKLENSDYTLKKENINSGSGRYYEIEWATLTIGSRGLITDCISTFPEAGNSGGGGGGSNFISDSDYTFSGDPNAILYTSSGTDWEIIILEAAAATLSFTKRPGSVDICLVAAGNNGYAGNAGNGNARKGGNGGEVLNKTGEVLEQAPYTITVGNATNGSDHDTSIYNQGASDPLIKAYQNNGQENGGNDTNANGLDGEYAFGDDEVLNTTYKTRKYGAGGGRGSVCSKNSSTGIWSTSVASGSGGTTGGGAGYPAGDGASAGNGLANTGSGGGGGRQGTAGGQTSYGAGGFGGSGIIIIRNHRTTPAA